MTRARGISVAWALSAAVALGFPLYFMLTASFAEEAELFGPRRFVPAAPTFEHYAAVLADGRLLSAIASSLIVATATTVSAIAIGAAAAYALARLEFPAKRAIVTALLAVAMFPQISIVAPLHRALAALGLIDTHAGLVLPYMTFALPLAVWLLHGYLSRIPPAFEEAARVDGASRFTAFREVLLPLALPGVVTTALVVFVYSWNEFLFALSFSIGAERHTVPVALALLRGRYELPWGQVMAAAVVTTLPVTLLAIAFQRRLLGALSGR